MIDPELQLLFFYVWLLFGCILSLFTLTSSDKITNKYKRLLWYFLVGPTGIGCLIIVKMIDKIVTWFITD